MRAILDKLESSGAVLILKYTNDPPQYIMRVERNGYSATGTIDYDFRACFKSTQNYILYREFSLLIEDIIRQEKEGGINEQTHIQND